MTYEYKCISIWGMGRSTTQQLNELGRDGWELIIANGFWHYFKRPIGSHAERGVPGSREISPVESTLLEYSEKRVSLLEDRIRMLEENNDFLQRFLQDRSTEQQEK